MKLAEDDANDPGRKMKYTLITMVKSTEKVSKIYGDIQSTVNISSYSITIDENNVFTIKDMIITTDNTGTFYLVVSCRGYHSDFMHSDMKIIIEEKINIVMYIVSIFEGIIAFGIAMIIIASSSNQFPVFLLPITLILMASFSIYVYYTTA